MSHHTLTQATYATPMQQQQPVLHQVAAPPTQYVQQHTTPSYLPVHQYPATAEYMPQVPQPIVFQEQAPMEAAPVSNRAIAADMSVAFMPYFAIKDMDNFLEVCNQCIEQVKQETLCLSYGFAISTGPSNPMAFCRELFANAEGVMAHLSNIELLFKEGLCRYGELVSLQIHGPKVELDKLREDPVIQEMNPEFYELMPGSFEIIEIPMQQMDYLPQEFGQPGLQGMLAQPMYGQGYAPQYEYVEEPMVHRAMGPMAAPAPVAYYTQPQQQQPVHMQPCARHGYHVAHEPGWQMH